MCTVQYIILLLAQLFRVQPVRQCNIQSDLNPFYIKSIFFYPDFVPLAPFSLRQPSFPFNLLMN
jgi:hypothetical protein